MRSGLGSRSAPRSHAVAGLLVAWVLVALLQPVGGAQTHQKGVLVFIATRRDAPASTVLDGTIRTVLNDGLAGRLDYYTEYLEVARFSEPDYQPAVRDFLRRKYASLTFDLIVATSDSMVDFVNTYRDELFPGVAVLFYSVRPPRGPEVSGR